MHAILSSEWTSYLRSSVKAIFADKPVDESQIVQGFYMYRFSCLSVPGLKF
ncbi:hypothetical protein EC845_2230 [Comamonas sp. BIGb0124]|nr:hypothetical protein EC845_2230 [Comamonas sp. BIGb0124]